MSKPFRRADYERAPDAPINTDVNHQASTGGFGGSRPYPGLIMAGRYSAAIRYHCPECYRAIRPVNMMRHRATHWREEGK